MSRGGGSAHYFVLWVPVPQPRICGLVEQGGGGRLEIGTATFGILAAATLGLAGTASAAPLEDGSAADAINQLRAQGYNVQLNLTNGYRDVPLSECSVLGVHGLSGTDAAGKPLTPAEVGTVYVDVNCPEGDD